MSLLLPPLPGRRRGRAADGHAARAACPSAAVAHRDNASTQSPALLSPSRRLQCPETESNCRHGDFQSPALPTELSGQRARRLPSAANDVNLLRQLGDDFSPKPGSLATSSRWPVRRPCRPPRGGRAKGKHQFFAQQIGVDRRVAAVLERAEEQLVAERPLDLVLDEPRAAARRVGVVALLGEVLDGRVGEPRWSRSRRRAAPRARG